MKRFLLLPAFVLALGISALAYADDANPTMPAPDSGEIKTEETVSISEESLASAELLPFERVVPEATKIGGLIPTYRKKDSLYWELTPANLGVDYIMIVSIARGVGVSELYGGQSIDFGDDLVWQFKKQDDRILIVRRNIRYRSNSGPDAEALRVAFADSILFSLPIIARGPQGGDVIDVSSLFLSDTLARIGSRALGGFSFARDRSTWEKVKALKDNLELEVAATYAGPAGSTETILDTRGVSVNIHYSISRLKDTGYKPRYADERVGYFNTVIRDISKISADDNFVRYINRWNLQKLEPSAEVSLPKKPIVYWLDKATPYQYRKTLREAVLEWNKAFEKAGFYNAIEVRQQEDNDDWDAEDINYNTIRWSATQTGFSIGPSRVNPTTGEILDADVVLSVGFLNSWHRQFELFTSDQNEKLRSSYEHAHEHGFADDEDYYTQRCCCGADLEEFYCQQFGLADTFFEVMALTDFGLNDTLDAALAESLAEEAVLSEEDEAKKAQEEAEAKAREEARAAEEQVARIAAEKAAEVAGKLAEDAKKAAEDAKNATDATREELTKKAQEAKEAADVARRVADETARKLDELIAKFDEIRKAEEEKKVAAEKAAEEAKKRADEAKEVADKNAAREANKKRLAEEKKKLFEQGLRQLVSHEVGHTLGLRHNFVQSTLHTLDEINDVSKWTEHGFVGSVMEYSPVNIMPKGRTQGDYFSYRLGEYDEWVIEYGYKVFPGKSTDSEVDDLKKIASKQSLPQFNYATDEDCYGSTVNPFVQIWDLGSSPLEYAKVRAQLVDQLMPGLTDQIVSDGESYSRLRTRFNILTNWKANGVFFAVNYIGGLKVHRDFKGDENGRKPFEVISAQEQREAMAFINETVFSVNSTFAPNEIYNYLAPNRWYHWGSDVPARYDLDVMSYLRALQSNVLAELLSSATLGRLADAEYRVPAGEDVFTSAEMVDSLNSAIFEEIDNAAESLKGEKKAETKLVITGQRRNLQRLYLNRLTSMATSTSTIAGQADLNILARAQLRKLQGEITALLESDVDVFTTADSRGQDRYTRAFLEDMNEKIKRTLDAIQTLGGGSGNSGASVILSL
ncbi:MAG: zinc-dependent metalloprotease [Planctomycetia bacterium]|nr:zinc-dependent metalloprotease [Planctomycetia bacterium]